MYMQKPVIKKRRCEACSHCCRPIGFFCRVVCPCCKFYSVQTFLFLLCCMILSYTMITSGFISGVMSSLQRQFSLSTSKIGVIISSFDILSIFAIPLVSYFGAKTNRPRLIALCAIAWVLGAGVFTLPYFLGPKYKILMEDTSSNSSMSIYEKYDLCRTFTNVSNSTTENSGNSELNCERNLSDSWPYYVFIAGQLLMSLGVAPTFSLGITYLCDNLEERSHALYTG